MGFMNSIFGGGKGKNPASAAAPYLDRIAPMAQQNLGPWAQQGQQAQTQNADQYSRMAQNPADVYAEMQRSYKPSTGYEVKRDRYKRAMEGVAASEGASQTPYHEEAQARLVQGLLGEDEGAYLDRLSNILGMGLQGNENIANRGFGAASDLTNIQGSTLANQGQLAFKGQENQNASKQGFQKFLMQLLGGGAGALLGGPMGAVTGANVAGGSIPYPNSSPSNQQQFGTSLNKSPRWGGNF